MKTETRVRDKVSIIALLVNQTQKNQESFNIYYFAVGKHYFFGKKVLSTLLGIGLTVIK